MREVVALPLFPQYSSAATGSALAALFAEPAAARLPRIIALGPFYDDPGFMRAWRDVAAPALAAFRPDHVLFSYHGLPERQIRAADTSGAHCLASADCCCGRARRTATATARSASRRPPRSWPRSGSTPERTSTSFQSRLGRTPWIRPYTDLVLPELAAAGVRRLAVLCPSFVADCLETVEEIGIRARDQWRGLGGEELLRVDCPNAHPTWVEAVAQLVLHAKGTAASTRDAAANPEASESETLTPAT